MGSGLDRAGRVLHGQRRRLKIVLADEHLVVVHKPAGLLVHRTREAPDRDTCLTRLRDQLGRRVFPCHRLDRGTSGLLVFALSPEVASFMGKRWSEVKKRYVGVTRGWWDPESQRIDHALDGQACQTDVGSLERFELPWQGRFFTSRYSLAEFRPLTGRRHQIRRHCKHKSHPLIGDTIYGKGEHNRLFRDKLGWERLALACVSLELPHPDGHIVSLEEPLSHDFNELLAQMRATAVS